MASPSRWAWFFLLSLQVIQALSLLPWLMMAGLSIMAFDSPGSEKMWQPWAFVLALWSYPVWLLAAGVGSWLLLLRGQNLVALAIGVVFTLPVPLVIFWLASAD
jgi:hypothetical protein